MQTLTPSSSASTLKSKLIAVLVAALVAVRQGPLRTFGQGQAVNTCANVIVYTLIDGQLFANSTNSATPFGIVPGVAYANFTPSANPGNVTTTFSVEFSNNLM